MIKAILYVTGASALISLTPAENISCYSCSSLPHPRNCMYLQRCQPNEVCFVEGRVTNSSSGNQTILYDSGCKPRDHCKAVVPSHDYNAHHKRASLTICDMCCDETFCNLNICDGQQQFTKGPRCLNCDRVAAPRDCLSVVQCQHDEICYTQEYPLTRRMYKLGCATEKVCPQTSIQKQLVGKRQTVGGGTGKCGQCCRGDHCNHNLCEGIFPEYTLTIDETAISSGKCEDKSYELCRYTLSTHGASCSDQNIKNLCPKSCNTCGDTDCVNNATFSCNEVSKAFNICSDVPNAKKFCRKFCDYCHTVNGGWSGWSNWTQCSATCGNGTYARSRNCSNPPPSPLGNPCQGQASEIRNCNSQPCPVNGKWTEWSMWSECTGNCSFGNATRTRSCSNPLPQNGGTNCTGEVEETVGCGIDESCKVNGAWSGWSQWTTQCSTTCGNGTQTRSRTCSNPPPSSFGDPCKGAASERRPCNSKPCPVDGGWSEWRLVSCTKDCTSYRTYYFYAAGGNVKECTSHSYSGSYTRTCNNPKPQYGGRNCAGESVDSRSSC